jgi:hypothetical protein
MASNHQALKRLLELSKLHSDVDAQNEQRELVEKIAHNLDVNLDEEATTHSDEEHAHKHAHHSDEERKVKKPAHHHSDEERKKPAPVEDAPKKSISSARERFEQESKAKKIERKPQRKSMPPPKSNAAPASAGGNECDLSDPKVVNAYESVRDDNTDTNWLLLGYGGSKKTLQLYGSGKGGLKEFVGKLPENEVVYGYLRVVYGDSGRSKFVFVTYVPDTLSGLAKAKANMHKPSVDNFLKYFHIHVAATTASDLQEATIQAKLFAAGGANYGTGGQAPAGSENFGNIKNNARSFFSETEKKGSVSIQYNKDPLAATTPVSLMGRAGITEKYIST